jgi:uncharacterized protein (TIGR03083 family)
MPAAPSDSYLTRVLPALDEAAERFTALVSGAADATVPVAGCPGWTVRDVAGHVAGATVMYGRSVRTPGPDGPVAAGPPPTGWNGLAASSAASAAELAALIGPELAALRARVAAGDGQAPEFRFREGPLVPADAGLGLLLGELVVHGHDVARALGRPWPIDPGPAALIIEGVIPVLPAQVSSDRTAGFTACFEIRPRGFASQLWEFRDGQLHVDPPSPRPIDVHLSADPAALVLVMYGRESQWRHIPAGRLVAWGRKPWLALTLSSRFLRP